MLEKIDNNVEIILKNLKELFSGKELLNIVENEISKSDKFCPETKKESIQVSGAGALDAVLNEDGERLAKLVRILYDEQKYDELLQITMDAEFRDKCFLLYGI